jgi:hypothetical protein
MRWSLVLLLLLVGGTLVWAQVGGGGVSGPSAAPFLDVAGLFSVV